MSTTCSCGARLAPDATWCSLCHAPVPTQALAARTGFVPGTAATAPRPPTTAQRRRFGGRYAATDVSVGPVMRCVFSAAVLAPMALMLALGQLASVIAYGIVFMSPALAALWKPNPRRVPAR